MDYEKIAKKFHLRFKFDILRKYYGEKDKFTVLDVGAGNHSASIFKTYVSEKYIKTCQDAVQIFGAYGYTKEYELERELRDALACSIYSGTNEMQKNTIYEMVKMMFG